MRPAPFMVVGQNRGRTPFQPRWRVRPSQDMATRSCIRDSESKRLDARPPQSRGLAMGAYTAFVVARFAGLRRTSRRRTHTASRSPAGCGATEAILAAAAAKLCNGLLHKAPGYSANAWTTEHVWSSFAWRGTDSLDTSRQFGRCDRTRDSSDMSRGAQPASAPSLPWRVLTLGS